MIITSTLLVLLAFTCREKPLAPRVDNVYDPLYPLGDDLPPAAAFSYRTSDHFTFRFDASESHESDNTPCLLCFRWDFENDGRWDTDWTTEAIMIHVYTQSGPKVVVLEAKGVKGLVGRQEGNVTATVPVYLQNMVLVPAGSFIMGSEYASNDVNPAPPHSVILFKAFWMSKWEITNEQYAGFLNDYGKDVDESSNKMAYERPRGMHKVGDRWEPQPGYERFPAVGVTWYGAARFAEWQGTRLPTEAEWEFAARGANDPLSCFYSSQSPQTLDYAEYAWFAYNSGARTHQVGERLPNRLGLYDLSGNVWEWCGDWYGPYPSIPAYDPPGPASGTFRVRRGGAYSDNAVFIFERFYSEPSKYGDDLGFRVVYSDY